MFVVLGTVAPAKAGVLVTAAHESISPPTTKLLSADLVSPSSAYNASTSSTVGLTFADPMPEVKVLSASLLGGRNLSNPVERSEYIARVFGYVRNNINIEFRYGLSKGARGALIDQSGTAFDQAQLMVELLRAQGVGASYQLGEISPDPQQFGLWSGLVKDLNQSSQSFAVDGKAACRFLADGGIPAVVNGAATCSSVSGALSSVVMSHLWVVVDGQVFDPAYKAHRLLAGLDLAASMGCGSGQNTACGVATKTAGMNGATSGAVLTTVQYIDGYKHTDVSTLVGAYGTNLQAAIKQLDINASVTDVVGGRELVEQTDAPALAYTARGGAWSGNIPDPYRTVLNVFTNSLCESFFADEIAGRALSYGPYYRIDDTNLNAIPYVKAQTNNCGTVATRDYRIPYTSIKVDHPYPANGGTYADEVVAFKPVDPPRYEVGIYRSYDPETGYYGPELPPAQYSPTDYPEQNYHGAWPMVVIHGFGQARSSAQKSASDRVAVGAFKTENACNPSTASDVVSRTCGNENQAVIAETINVYRTLSDAIVDGVAKTATTRHHDIGIVYASRTQELSRVTMHEGLSVNAATGAEDTRQAGFELQAILLSEIEGASSITGGGATQSFMSYFGQEAQWLASLNSPPTARRIYDIPSDKMASFLQTLPDSYFVEANGQRTYGFDCIRYTPSTNVGCWRKYQLQDVADLGFSTLMLQGGSSELFYKSSNERAYTLWEYMKGGGVVSDPLGISMKSTEIVQAGAQARKLANVSAATGELSLTAAPDIVAGAGEFPLSLPFIRTFNPSYRERVKEATTQYRFTSGTQAGGGIASNVVRRLLKSGGDAQLNDRLGGGWQHNYEVFLIKANDPSARLGSEYALFAAFTIAKLRVAKDLISASDLPSRVSAIAAVNGILTYYGSTNDNVIVKMGASNVSFHCCVDGKYYSHQAPTATVAPLPYPSADWRYVGSGGDVIDFSYYYRTQQKYDIQTAQPIDSYLNTWNLGIMKADKWAFANGVTLKFDYNYRLLVPPGSETWFPCSAMKVDESSSFSSAPCKNTNVLPAGYILLRVSNNLGRSLTFSSSAFEAVGGGQFGYRIESVKDETGRTATFDKGPCTTFTCDYFSVTAPGVGPTRYEYTASADAPDPANPIKPDYQLRRIYTPGNQSSPAVSISYDNLFRVKEVKDANGAISRYYPAGIYGVEDWKPSEVLSPTLARSTIVFDRRNGALRSVDPLKRETRQKFDRANRVIRTDLPSGVAEERQYDRRGNLLATCIIPRQTQSGQIGRGCQESAGDIVTRATYVEAENVITCANLVVCDKPASETDARGYVTNYSWDTTTGQLTKILKPAGAQTDLVYDAYTGTDGGTLRLLGRKTEKVSASQNIVTTYAYDAANKFVLRSATVDPDGAARSTTCLRFDPVGNLTGTTDPRAATCP